MSISSACTLYLCLFPNPLLLYPLYIIPVLIFQHLVHTHVHLALFILPVVIHLCSFLCPLPCIPQLQLLPYPLPCIPQLQLLPYPLTRNLHVSLFLNFYVYNFRPIPVAMRPKAWVYSRSLAGFAVSNPAGDVDICLL